MIGESDITAGLQLRRAINIQAEGIRLLEKHATAPSAARLCSAARCHVTFKVVEDSLHDEAAGGVSRCNRRNLAPLDEI